MPPGPYAISDPVRYDNFGNKIYNDIVTPSNKTLTAAAAVPFSLSSALFWRFFLFRHVISFQRPRQHVTAKMSPQTRRTEYIPLFQTKIANSIPYQTRNTLK